ncbi:MAG: ATP-dependent DNA helicase RecQ [bacterium]
MTTTLHAPKHDLEVHLHKHFGFSAFHPGQRQPIEAVLAGGDVIVVMPTGSGKSICFQLPAMMLEGITLVVSPLISLMKDQVDGLTKGGLPATAIHSMLTTEEVSERVADLRRGHTRLVYVAPERFRSKGFQNLLSDLNVAMIAIDEAHCVSQWGHDFRPDYLRLGSLIQSLPRARVMALTATATPEVRADIAKQLGLGTQGRITPQIFVSGFRRDNLRLVVSHVSTHSEKMGRIAEIHSTHPTGIVYCSTRKQVERVGSMLGDMRIKHTIYHAGLTDLQRQKAQDLFMSGTVPVVVATNAFGMGVDRSDLRFVIHWDVPGSIEAYYQEIGRAGRDGLSSHCELLYNYADVRTQEFFLDGSNPDPSVVTSLWTEVRGRLQAGPQTCTLEEWGEQVSSTDNKITVHTCMGLYERCGLIEREIKTGSRCYTTSLVPGTNLKRLQDQLPALKEKRGRDLRKLDLMLRYTNTNQCRHAFILEYFGDPDGIQGGCGCCDHCGFDESVKPRSPTEEEWPVIQKLLSCVGRLDGRFGKATLLGMASGSQSKEILERNLNQLPLHGILAGTPADYLKEIFDGLVRAGAIVLTSDPYAVASLTTKGRDIAWRRETVLLKWPAYNQQPAKLGARHTAPAMKAKRGKHAALENLERVLSATEDTLFEDLKEWRRGEASHQGIPPYLIFSNKSLKAMAILRPTSLSELEKVPGVGPAKLEEYGADLLRMIGRA